MLTPDPDSKVADLNPDNIGLIRAHLQEVISSSTFAGGKRAQDFLRLVVEHSLAGRIDNLRERMIGAEMFGRPIDYDTANDAVVRVKATEVRRKLAQYYLQSKEPRTIRIELPSGTYVPTFYWESRKEPQKLDEVPVPQPSPPAAELLAISEESPGEQAPAHIHINARPTHRSRHLLAGLLTGLALTLIAVYVVIHMRSSGFLSKGEIHSIAVLPLQNLSGDAHQDYFSDGMTEELIADLGQISALSVISRTSAMSYKNTKKTLPEIAHELGVDAVVEGSVLREGNRVRITAQLIDAKTDRHIWARNYVRDLTSVLALQGEMAQAIADEISINVTPQEQARLARARRIEPAAQDDYLLAVERLNSGDPKDAIGYLQRAIGEDPNYAQAHAALANSYGWMGEAGWMPYAEAFSHQKAEALKAIELDDALPAGHVELANAAMNLDWDWNTQEKELKRALELNPNSAPVLWAYSNHQERLGRLEDAIAESKLALQLDPVSSRAFIDSAFSYYFARQYDEALAQMHRASTLPQSPLEAPFPLGDIYAEKGMYNEAILQFQKLGPAPHALGHMGNVYARMGRSAEALEIISKLQDSVRQTGVGRYEIALVYAGLGKKDEAFSALESSLATRDKGLTYLKIDPCLDPLRSDPRFQSFLHRVGLPS
ncbi:TPR end-of-group domain-containing protein [Granulicella aggregans]|jgi:TolB-like protein|uniref:TPR end-of-group domain-containing protein n=1 Tax=Granulicella aggregans TaxID=474949 RepID=UPI0021E02830|nr:tetratricopeptide repeat protein [Granulicella aggregans]